MKKIITIISFAMILCLSAVPAFASEINEVTPNGQSTVYYKIGDITNPNNPDDPTDDEIAGTYTVSIPDFIDAASSQQTPITQEVTASDVLIPYNTTLSVSVNYDKTLRLKDNPDITVGYTLQKEGANINTGAMVLSVPAGNPNAVTRTAVGAILTENPVYSGVYTNTATFAVSVD